MKLYGTIIDNNTGLCSVGTGTNIEFYKSIGMLELDVQQSDIDNAWYLAEKCPMKTDEEKAKEEQDKINHLTMTALDFVTYIKKVGVSDEIILRYLQANPSVQLQLTLCQNVYCGVVRQLCPIKITEQLIITDEQVVNMFKDKHKIV